MKKIVGVAIILLLMGAAGFIASHTKVNRDQASSTPSFVAHVPPQCAAVAMQYTHGKSQVQMEAQKFFQFQAEMNNCFAAAKKGSIEQEGK